MSAELLRTVAAPARQERDPSAAADIRWLVDNADAYREIVSTIGRARRSVWITQLAFDADCVAHDYAPHLVGSSEELRLLDVLLDASRERGVAVRILLNDTLLLDTATPLRAALESIGGIDVCVRGVKRFPQLLHAKMLIVDECEAMLLGSPFVNGYWDDACHAPSDARRPVRELGGRPLHDLSALVTGPAAAQLSAIFAELWNDVSSGAADDAPIDCRPVLSRERESCTSMRVVRTAPARVLRDHPDGVCEILEAVERALATARRLVYVEHQYLSSRRVIAALVAALAREPALEIVIVLNQNPDVTAYRGWQNARLRESGLLTHPRVGLFALWRATPAEDSRYDWTVNQLFVHSKLLVIDDRWLTMGSANLDGVSLHSYGDDFTGFLARRVFDGVRNFDVNVVVESEVGSPSSPVEALRVSLWVEHLALPPADVLRVPMGGWLGLWRSRSAASTGLLGSRPTRPRSDETVAMVLPYSPQATPRGQLDDAGVQRLDRLDVRFDPGWLEVHFSPNWVRNMFI